MYGLAADGDFGGEYTGGAPAGAGQQPASITQGTPAGPVFYDYTTEQTYRIDPGMSVPAKNAGQVIAGLSNSTLAIGAAAVVLLLVLGRRR